MIIWSTTGLSLNVNSLFSKYDGTGSLPSPTSHTRCVTSQSLSMTAPTIVLKKHMKWKEVSEVTKAYMKVTLQPLQSYAHKNIDTCLNTGAFFCRHIIRLCRCTPSGSSGKCVSSTTIIMFSYWQVMVWAKLHACIIIYTHRFPH